MRNLELELYKKPWTMNTHKPQKRVFFTAEENVINKADIIGIGFAEMRLWEIVEGKKEFICSGAIF